MRVPGTCALKQPGCCCCSVSFTACGTEGAPEPARPDHGGSHRPEDAARRPSQHLRSFGRGYQGVCTRARFLPERRARLAASVRRVPPPGRARASAARRRPGAGHSAVVVTPDPVDHQGRHQVVVVAGGPGPGSRRRPASAGGGTSAGGAAAYHLAVDGEDRLVGVPVDRVGVRSVTSMGSRGASKSWVSAGSRNALMPTPTSADGCRVGRARCRRPRTRRARRTAAARGRPRSRS